MWVDLNATLETAMSSNSMIPSPHKGKGQATTRIERWEEPQPGTYWRLKKGFGGDHDEEAQITGNSVKKGAVLMLSGIEMADGAPHVYVFSPHPSLEECYRFPIKVHADVFFDWFCFAPDGEAVRSSELLELQRQMAETQARMMQPPPDAVPVASLTFDPGASDDSQGTELATRDSIADMERYAENVRENAAVMTKWIESNTTELGQQATAMARFHGERAQASLAKANQQLDSVKGLLRTVENLKLYIGDGVEVVQVTDGEGAPAHSPMTVYQEVLALDEETALHLESGGLDHTHIDELETIFSDHALVDRLIPSPRGIVLVRFRESHKTFFAGEDMASRFADAAMNAQSRLKHLLVRDGHRLWLVLLPEELQGLKQLMPNAAEMTQHFSTRAGKEIKREHLHYAKAQRDQLGSLNAYAKVLIILWGLYDRQALLKGWVMPQFTNWLDPAIQARYMLLCDQSSMLGQDHEHYDQFRRRHNQYLGAGATVAVKVSSVFTQSNIPGAFASQSRYDGRSYTYSSIYHWDRTENASVLVARAHNDAKGIYVEIPLIKSYSYETTARRITGKLYLTSGDSDHYLVLDRVHGPDMTYFLTSRSQRRSYENYLLLFQSARAWVDQRDASEAHIRKELRAAAAAGGLSAEPAHMEASITSAMAVARTARRDKSVPETGGAAYKKYLHAALDTLHALLTEQDGRVAKVEQWADENGRQPLRLSLAGGSHWRLYLVPVAGEHEPLLGEARHATVATINLSSTDMQVTVTGRDLLRPRADEQVIRDWEVEEIIPGDPKSWSEYEKRDKKIQHGATAWQGKKSLFEGVGYSDALAIIDMIRNGNIQPPSPEDAFAAAKAYMDADKSRSVARMAIGLPVGMMIEGGHGTPIVLFAQADALAFAYHEGGEDMKRRVCDLINGRYANPKSHLETLRKQKAAPWSATAAVLAVAKTQIKHGYAKDPLGYVRDEAIKLPKAKKPASWNEYQLNGLSPLGAKLLPWAAKLTAAPI